MGAEGHVRAAECRVSDAMLPVLGQLEPLATSPDSENKHEPHGLERSPRWLYRSLDKDPRSIVLPVDARPIEVPVPSLASVRALQVSQLVVKMRAWRAAARGCRQLTQR